MFNSKLEASGGYTSSLYGSGSSVSSTSSSSFNNIEPGVMIVAAIIALIVAIFVFIFVVQRKKAFRGRFAKWLREFLNFRSILISGIIKFVYVFLAVFLTIMGFVVMFQGKDDTVLPMIGAGLLIIIVGNILLRITMELTMAMIVVWGNTSDIRSIMFKREEALETEEPENHEGGMAKEEPVTQEIAVEQQQIEVMQPQPEQPEVQQPEIQQPEA